ncbi:transferase, partial [Streptomyces cavourensis]
MRIGLLTEGGYPYATGESRLWCDRLVHGLPQHEFDLFALSRSADQEDQGWVRLPHHVGRVRTAPLWTPEDGTPRGSGERGLLARLVTGGGVSYGRRDRRRF